MGYGVALSGAKDWTALGNVILPGTSFIGNTALAPLNAPPMPFLIEWKDRARTVDCEVQEEFVEGTASWLIGVESGVGEELRYEGGQLHLGEGQEGPQVAGGVWGISEGRFCLKEDGAGGRVVWASGAGTKEATRLGFARHGRLALATKEEAPLWDPTAYLRSFLETMSTLKSLTPSPPSELEQHPSLTLSCKAPFLSLRDGAGNVLFSTSYEYEKGHLNLLGGQWIAIAPLSLRGSTSLGLPPIPSRPTFSQSSLPSPPRLPLQPTFLFLNPLTAQLTLHSSPSPSHPLPSHTHWSSPPSAARVEGTWMSFQGDGNLVVYAKEGERVWVPWANGSMGSERMVLRGVGEEGGPAVEVFGEGRKVWSSGA